MLSPPRRSRDHRALCCADHVSSLPKSPIVRIFELAIAYANKTTVGSAWCQSRTCRHKVRRRLPGRRGTAAVRRGRCRTRACGRGCDSGANAGPGIRRAGRLPFHHGTDKHEGFDKCFAWVRLVRICNHRFGLANPLIRVSGPCRARGREPIGPATRDVCLGGFAHAAVT